MKSVNEPSAGKAAPRFRELVPMLWNRLGAKRWVLMAALVFCLAETVIMMLVPWIMEVYFNHLEEGRSTDVQWLLLRAILIMMLIAGVGLLGHYIKQDRISSLHRDVTLELADHAQRLPLERAQSAHTADLTQRILHDSNRTTQIVPLLFQQMGSQIVMLLLACIYMLALQWQLAVAVMALMPLGLLGSHLLRHKLQRIGQQVADQEAVVRQSQQDALQCMETVRAFGAEDWMLSRFQEQRSLLNRLLMRRMWLHQLVNGLTNTLALAISWGAVLIVAWLAVQGKLQLGSLMAFFILIWRVYNPLYNLGRQWGEAQGLKGSAARMLALANAVKEPAAPAAPAHSSKNRPEEHSAVHWNGVEFRYAAAAALDAADARQERGEAEEAEEPTGDSAAAPALHSLKLQIQPGEFVAFVGPSGSGKSTAAKLGAGLLFPSAGEVRLFGASPQEDAESARHYVSYVPQTPYLFAGSIRDNLLAAKPEASDAEIVEAAVLAQAHDFIAALPDGYDTRISEHGGSLSGGQRQRLAIARALLADRPVWIMDEATSALDVDTERKVMEAVLRRARSGGRTLVVIAHRLTAVTEADRIVAMAGGETVEQGTHRELLERGQGLYRKLWQHMQSGAGEAVPAGSNR